MKPKALVVIANRQKAECFKVTKVGVLDPMDSWSTDQVLDQDHSYDKHHPFCHESLPKDKQILEFAKQIAKNIEMVYLEGHFESLYLAAEPKFLGILKKILPKHLHQHLEHTVSKDLVGHPPQTLFARCAFVV